MVVLVVCDWDFSYSVVGVLQLLLHELPLNIPKQNAQLMFPH